MGVTNHFDLANARLKSSLGYHLDPRGSEQFRDLLQRTGLRRFETTVDFLAERKGNFASKGALHKELLNSMRLSIPKRNPGTKFRSHGARYRTEVEREMDGRALLLANLDD